MWTSFPQNLHFPVIFILLYQFFQFFDRVVKCIACTHNSGIGRIITFQNRLYCIGNNTFFVKSDSALIFGALYSLNRFSAYFANYGLGIDSIIISSYFSIVIFLVRFFNLFFFSRFSACVRTQNIPLIYSFKCFATHNTLLSVYQIPTPL